MTRPAPSATKREAPVSETVATGKPHDIASSMLRLMASHRDVHASTSAARYQGHGSACNPGSDTTLERPNAAMSCMSTGRVRGSASPPIQPKSTRRPLAGASI